MYPVTLKWGEQPMSARRAEPARQGFRRHLVARWSIYVTGWSQVSCSEGSHWEGKKPTVLLILPFHMCAFKRSIFFLFIFPRPCISGWRCCDPRGAPPLQDAAEWLWKSNLQVLRADAELDPRDSSLWSRTAKPLLHYPSVFIYRIMWKETSPSVLWVTHCLSTAVLYNTSRCLNLN